MLISINSFRFTYMVYTDIAIVNQSTYISDSDGTIITSALNLILPTFCNDWNISPVTAVYVNIGNTTNISLKVFLLDDSDVSKAFGYHDNENNIPTGKCIV